VAKVYNENDCVTVPASQLKEMQERIAELSEQVGRYEKALEEIRSVVDAQADDEGLWSLPFNRLPTIAESHLQKELRRLHAVIESAGGEI
jgi:hypothetical protein